MQWLKSVYNFIFFKGLADENDNFSREIWTGRNKKKKSFFPWNISSNCYNFEATQTLKIPTRGLDKVSKASVTFMFPAWSLQVKERASLKGGQAAE